MSAESSGAMEPFDLEKLRELIALMEEHGLSEIDLRRQDQRWKLRRGPAEVMQMLPPAGYPTGHLPMSAPPVPSSAGPSSPAAPAADTKDSVSIKSPTVGTFYE